MKTNDVLDENLTSVRSLKKSVRFLNKLSFGKSGFIATKALFLGSLLLLGSCRLADPVQTPATLATTRIYTAGFEANSTIKVSKYWVNQAASPFVNGPVSLTPSVTGRDAIGTGIFLSGMDIYTSGTELVPGVPNPITNVSTTSSYAVYWKNGVQTTLSTSGSSTTSGISVQGTDVYVVGVDTDHATYWKNGAQNTLPLSGSATRSAATAITIVNGDVYISGYTVELVPVPGTTGSQTVARLTPVYWKNGALISLPAASQQSRATAIKVMGNDVYLAGNDGTTAVYWKNGTKTTLAGGTYGATATGIAINGSNIYVSGSTFSSAPTSNPATTAATTGTAVLWKNGSLTTLAASPSFATGIVFDPTSTGDYYISGNENGKSVFWYTDGATITQTNLTTGANAAIANAIAL